MDGEATAQWLIKEVNNDHIRQLKDSLTKKICELGNIPDVADLGSFGASGAALKFKLISTETGASKQERVVYKGIQRKLELLYNILRITDPGIGNYTDVNITFERNFIMLADDKLREMQVDLQRVTAGLMSYEKFLVKYENLTADEAREEIQRIYDERLAFDFDHEYNVMNRQNFTDWLQKFNEGGNET